MITYQKKAGNHRLCRPSSPVGEGFDLLGRPRRVGAAQAQDRDATRRKQIGRQPTLAAT